MQQQQGMRFRKSVFGGFNRDDVVSYIAKASHRMLSETEEMRERCAQIAEANNRLESSCADVSRQNGDLSQHVAIMAQSNEELRAKLSLHEARLEECERRIRQLENEVGEFKVNQYLTGFAAVPQQPEAASPPPQLLPAIPKITETLYPQPKDETIEPIAINEQAEAELRLLTLEITSLNAQIDNLLLERQRAEEYIAKILAENVALKAQNEELQALKAKLGALLGEGAGILDV